MIITHDGMGIGVLVVMGWSRWKPMAGHGLGHEQGQTTGNKQFHLPTAVSK